MTSEPDAFTAMTPLTIERGGTQQEPTLTAQGEIDVATSPALRSELTAVLANAPRTLTLDFRGITFVDSSGLGVLVGALKRLRESGGSRFAIVGMQEPVRKVFDITGLSTLFELE